jgi:hypothetical protein
MSLRRYADVEAYRLRVPESDDAPLAEMHGAVDGRTDQGDPVTYLHRSATFTQVCLVAFAAVAGAAHFRCFQKMVRLATPPRAATINPACMLSNVARSPSFAAW